MNLLRVAVTSLISLAALFLLTKLMGNKQVSQMNLFDYIVGITIGSIAAEMATELDTPENSLLAMVIYAVVAVIISLLTNKSLAARRIMTGKPLILMDGGVIYRDNLKKAKMDLGEFLMYCRIGGYFDLSQIQTALLDNAARYVALGGVLVYSACTILAEENEQVTDAFLTEHSDFRRDGFSLPEPVGETEGQLTLWPQCHHTDGFYICRMKRT